MAVKTKINVGIFGFGRMGQAIFKLLKSGSNRGRFNFFVHSLGVNKVAGAVCLNSFEELVKKSDYVFLCLKPQDFYRLNRLKTNSKIFLSIMAGVKIGNLKKIVNSQKIVRLMPNLALEIGRGVIGWFKEEKQFTERQLNTVKIFLAAFGTDFKVTRESNLDKITGLTGSGPAYVFLFLDALIKSGINLGFSEKQSREMIIKLTDGSLNYFAQTDLSAEELIKGVASKRGTTEAALKKLDTAKFYKNWRAAVSQAYKRAREISNHEIK